ncbi:hypothetical protein CA13_09410 [Planctomycetes bacterium CA13]|uniref:Uncharacterized protein n=1 Tax=Novipirellula herctigrandis TaxID=2527986 RepID=A0A5C5YY92_9BACT|nr:hypothetical protein CA13_09410 [Planctomycetes bacterium CA13]
MTADDALFVDLLKWMRSGGVELDVGVTREVLVGDGAFARQDTEPFVAVGPVDREDSGTCTYFSDAATLDAFIRRLTDARNSAFGND